jgi:hypothetical protein
MMQNGVKFPFDSVKPVEDSGLADGRACVYRLFDDLYPHLGCQLERY